MEQRIGIERMEEAVNLFGSFDENIRLLEAEFQVQAVNRGGEIVVSGEPENVMLAVKAVQALLTLSNKGETITDQHVRYVIGLVRSGQAERISELTQDVICITSKGRPVKPKTIGQKEYVNAILKQTVTIGVGPAGTGKTYLAVAAAVALVVLLGLVILPLLLQKSYKRLSGKLKRAPITFLSIKRKKKLFSRLNLKNQEKKLKISLLTLQCLMKKKNL